MTEEEFEKFKEDTDAMIARSERLLRGDS